MSPFLVQQSLVLSSRNCPSGPGAYPDCPTTSDGRGVRRMNGNDGNVAFGQAQPIHEESGRREDVAVGLDVGELQQQLVGDVQPHGLPVVLQSYEDYPGPPMAGQIVAERAYGFANPIGRAALDRLLAFDQFRLQVGGHCPKLRFRIRFHRSSLERGRLAAGDARPPVYRGRRRWATVHATGVSGPWTGGSPIGPRGAGPSTPSWGAITLRCRAVAVAAAEGTPSVSAGWRTKHVTGASR